MRKSELKELLEYSIYLYVETFCRKHKLSDGCWVNDYKGGIYNVSDMFLSFDDIRLDIDKSCHKEYLFDWYWNNDHTEGGKHITYDSYIKGLRVSEL